MNMSKNYWNKVNTYLCNTETNSFGVTLCIDYTLKIAQKHTIMFVIYWAFKLSYTTIDLYNRTYKQKDKQNNLNESLNMSALF